jgi:membrane protease YdiL (CAAX protease family)
LFLAAHGIEAKVFGDRNAWEAGIAFTVASAPGVFVAEADLEAAAKLLDEFLAGPVAPKVRGTWSCPECEKSVAAQFDTCWKCGTARGDVPVNDESASSADEVEDLSTDAQTAIAAVELPLALNVTRSNWHLLLEVLIVLTLTKPLYGGASVASAVLHAIGLRNDSHSYYLFSDIACAFQVVVVLGVIRLSGESLSTFGITRPSSVDIVTGGIVYFVGRYASLMGTDMFVDVLDSIYGIRYVDRLLASKDYVYRGDGITGPLALLLLAICVGFAEEIVARGYLIPRLERLLRSSWAAVLGSAILFGLFHWYRGIVSMWSAFIIGLIYGIAFAWTRRLWPVVIAHSVTDFAAFLSHWR